MCVCVCVVFTHNGSVDGVLVIVFLLLVLVPYEEFHSSEVSLRKMKRLKDTETTNPTISFSSMKK